MISTKRFVQMTKKWQRMVALTRKRLTLSTPTEETGGSCCTSVSVADKGHCVVYSADGRRFEVPLAYLSTAVFGKVLMLSQEEFGFTGEDGRILLPCDAMVMDYVMCMLRRGASVEVETAFLSSIVRPCHYGISLAQSMGGGQQVVVPTF